MRSIKEVENLKGVRVLVRLDLNVPIQNGKILDDYRIQKSLPIIRYLNEKGSKVILISHIETKENPTLEPVCKYLNNLGINCEFERDYRKVMNSSSDIILLENLRTYEGEKSNDKKFAKELASLADIYVNEAFPVSHREHASVCAITEFIPSYAGIQFSEEIEHLSSAFNPEHPFLFILGGLKFDTKLPLLEKFIGIADKVFVGGALANNFLKEQGMDIGKSIYSPKDYNLSKMINTGKILLPIDTIISQDMIMDCGMDTIEMLSSEIEKAKYILWNGPLGAYEAGYKERTQRLAELIANATENGAKSILGGGDTIATISELKLEDKYTFVSTGGGAMLDYLARGTLPGIDALNRSES